MDWERKLAGAGVRRARQDRDDHGSRTADEVCALRRQAARSATVCADCFQPLAPAASVTIVNRRIVIPPATDWRGAPVPEHDAWLRVPICLTCWLIEMQREAAAEVGDGRLPGLRDRHVNELRALDGIGALALRRVWTRNAALASTGMAT